MNWEASQFIAVRAAAAVIAAMALVAITHAVGTRFLFICSLRSAFKT